MKRFAILFAALVMICLLVGCDFAGDTNYNSDLTVVLPEDVTVEHFTPAPDTEYYTSEKLVLCMSVHGCFMDYKVFSLEGDNRVYDEIIFTSTDGELSGYDGIYYLREAGTYDVILNFSTYELSVERLPE